MFMLTISAACCLLLAGPQAAEFGHLECCKVLMDAKANTRVKNARNHTCLMRACATGHADVVEYLIVIKCNVKVRLLFVAVRGVM